MVLEYFWGVCYLVGLYYAVFLLTRLYNILYPLIFKNDWSKYGIGSWAVITGATDGIGYGFAQVLAERGYNIVLISRSPSKLQEKASELKSSYNIQVRTIPSDISRCNENPTSFFQEICQQLDDLDVSILINNVGTASTGKFHTVPFNAVNQMLSLNIWPEVYMTHNLLPKLMKRTKPSAIINLSSVAGTMAFKGYATYCAGKAFDDFFSRTLSEEMNLYNRAGKCPKIDVLSLRPAYVETPLASAVKSKPMCITARECATAALNSLGKINASHCHPKHWIFVGMNKIFPQYFINKVLLDLYDASDKKE